MNNKYYISFILILVICLIIFNGYILYYNNGQDNIPYNINPFLNGYWESDVEFSKLSNIDNMILNLNTDRMDSLLVIIMDNEISSSNEFKFNIENKQYDKKNNIYQFDIDMSSDNIDFIWDDKKFNGHLSIDNGLLELYDNDILMAKLVKNNSITLSLN